MAELELEATHRDAYALIMSLGSSLPMRPRNCKLKREAGPGSTRLDPTPLLLQLHLQPQLRCRGGHNFLRCAGKEDPSIMEVGPARKNNSNSAAGR